MISSVYAQVHLRFQQLVDTIRDKSLVADRHEELKQFEDEFAKFKLWGGNLGAAHSGKTYEISLDYRLQEAQFYKTQVLKLLNTLEDHIARAILILQVRSHSPEDPSRTTSKEDDLSDGSESSDSGGGDQKIEDESPWEISSHSSSDPPSSARDDRGEAVLSKGASVTTPIFAKALTIAPSTTDSEPLSHLAQVHSSISFTITCLYKLPIRHPAPLDRLRQKNFIDQSPYEHFDVLYIRDKFPRLGADVSSRLGKMITRRRQLLHLRETHSKNLDFDRPPPEASVIGSYQTLKTKATMLKNFELPPGELLYASSVPESKPSIASSYTERELNIDIPPRPKGENGDELDYFECPYCRVAKRIKSKHQWEKHVFEDLKPYVCTFPDCVMSEHLFENRKEWYNHEKQYHRLDWSCNTNGHPDFQSHISLIQHMSASHGVHMDEMKLITLRAMFQTPSKKRSGICNLCGVLAERLETHVAHHLQQISLFALPRVNAIQGSGDAEFDTQSSRSKGDEQIQTHKTTWRSRSNSSSAESEDSNVSALEKNMKESKVTERTATARLRVAVEKENVSLTRSLLDDGADIDDSLLIAACEAGNEEMVQLLVDRAAPNLDINVFDSILIKASKIGQVSVVRLLLESGRANVNATNDLGYTPLMMAAEAGHLSTVLLLIHRGADVNRRNSLNITALMMAARAGQESAVRLLLENHAEVEPSDDIDHATFKMRMKVQRALKLSREQEAIMHARLALQQENSLQLRLQEKHVAGIPTRQDHDNLQTQITQANQPTSSEPNLNFSGFQQMVPPEIFFTAGKVFAILFNEDMGEGIHSPNPKIDNQSYISDPERTSASFSVQRFVVVEAMPSLGFSYCCPITTYGGLATTKEGVDQGKHTIVYSQDKPPSKLPEEVNLTKDPLRVIVDDGMDQLSPLSRINLGKIIRVDHEVKVKAVGMMKPMTTYKLLLYVNECSISEENSLRKDQDEDEDQGDDEGKGKKRGKKRGSGKGKGRRKNAGKDNGKGKNEGEDYIITPLQ